MQAARIGRGKAKGNRTLATSSSSPTTDPPDPRPQDPLSEDGQQPQKAAHDTRLQRLAALPHTLKDAEFRVAAHLAALDEAHTNHHTVTVSARELSRRSGLARSTVQLALDALAGRGTIALRQGTTTKPAAYRLNFLETAVIRGPIAGPPLARMPGHPGPNAGPPLDLQPGHPWPDPRATPGPNAGPPAIEEHARASAPVDSDSDSIRILDRVLRAHPRQFEKELIEKARGWLLGYKRKLGGQTTCHPPDDTLCAQFLSIAPWPDLEAMLYDLMKQEACPGIQDAWFVSVALHRIHGIDAKTTRHYRAQLRLVREQTATATQSTFAEDLVRQVAAKTGGL
jgi:hypothetical protein